MIHSSLGNTTHILLRKIGKTYKMACIQNVNVKNVYIQNVNAKKSTYTTSHAVAIQNANQDPMNFNVILIARLCTCWHRQHAECVHNVVWLNVQHGARCKDVRQWDGGRSGGCVMCKLRRLRMWI